MAGYRHIVDKALNLRYMACRGECVRPVSKTLWIWVCRFMLRSSGLLDSSYKLVEVLAAVFDPVSSLARGLQLWVLAAMLAACSLVL